MSELQELKTFSKLLAGKSAEVIKKYFRSDIKIESKSDESPVTIADKKAEEVMREIIMKEHPEHGILGEEFGNYNEGAEYQWTLDPIDGTKSFISGALSFGTLISLLKNSKPIIGVINHPILDEFLFGDNLCTDLNGKIVKVRECNDLSQATLLTTDHLNVEKYQDLGKFEKLMRQVKVYRQWGDCYGYYLLATGYADIMVDPIMSPWDTMALIPIIRGAGGVITDYKGNDPLEGSSIIATVPGINQQVLNILK